jgi:hypothetical protein
MNEKRLAKDVAIQLERRARRRRVVFLLLVLALVALAYTYMRCGSGFGFGGEGAGSGGGGGGGSSGGAQPVADPPKTCRLRIAASGITVDGVAKTRDEAIAACQATTGAEVTVIGDTRQGDWDDLRKALEIARVPILSVRHPRAPR